ncbi:hypothetical protein F8A87_07585 [Betaproteobacteria bacterium SCN2]|jgi:hypothetical protein|nr:hypothetical protein F8A87_07585 [Betaproteobacteria bacterium SCN2]
MKKSVLLAVCALPFAFMQSQAGEFAAEPAVTAYWQAPLAVSKTGKEQQAFGLRFDQVVRDNTGNLVSSFSTPQRAALVDFRFNDRGLNGVYVHGVNMATPAIMKAAEGTGGTALWIAGGVTLGMLGIAIWGGDDSSNNSCGYKFNFNVDCLEGGMNVICC